MIYEILEEMNRENGNLYKLKVAKRVIKEEKNQLFQKVASMALDKVKYTYGITSKNLSLISNPSDFKGLPLSEALDELSFFCDRTYTGNKAIEKMNVLINSLSHNNQSVLLRVIDRDLKIGFGRSQFNKVLDEKYKIKKPVYCRCKPYTEDKIIFKEKKEKKVKGTSNKIKYPAFWQLKEDGTYRMAELSSNVGIGTNFVSRSGEDYLYESFKKDLDALKIDGYLIGEMTVKLDYELLEKMKAKLSKDDYEFLLSGLDGLDNSSENEEYFLPRKFGNGLLNSDNVPNNNIVYTVWDYIREDEYNLASLKDKKNPPKMEYLDRFEELKEILNKIDNKNIRLVETHIVNSKEEAFKLTVKVMNKDLEGGILKDFGLLFKDGTSSLQLKLKISFDLDVRIIGFKEGKKGTKRAKTFGSIEYSTDDGQVKGFVSGLSDKELLDINSRRAEYIGTIITIEGNALEKSNKNDYYSISHPRIIEFRKDKNTTDNLKTVKESFESSKNFK